MNELFIGYDLGDGETSISIITPGSSEPIDLTMPSQKDQGQPMPSVFAVNTKNNTVVLGENIFNCSEENNFKFYVNFKKCPSSLIRGLKDKELDKLSKYILSDQFNWNDETINKFRELVQMKENIRLFTNAVFLDKKIKEQILNFSECDEITIFVGHPTKWNKLDVVLYKSMIKESILGNSFYEDEGIKIKLSLYMEAESRAAFLYGRKTYISYQEEKNWDIDKYSIVIDVGSSTTDITALSGRSVDSIHNDGDKYLGAQLIDIETYKYFKKKISEKGQKEMLDSTLSQNESAEKLYILACRKAKEKYFSFHNNKTKVESPYDATDDLRIEAEGFNEILNTPIALLNGQIWGKAFENFIIAQKKQLDDSKRDVNRVILTGSASRMDFILETCKKVFTEKKIYNDINPSKAISQGLALVGVSNKKSIQFQKEANKLFGKDLEKTIKSKVNNLAEKLSNIISQMVIKEAKSKLIDWKNEKYTTINDAIKAIEKSCSEKELEAKLKNNREYNAVIKEWIKTDLIRTINGDLLDLCRKYGLTNFTTKDIDITNVKIKSGSLTKDISGTEIIDFKQVDMFAGIIGIVSGIITFVVFPSVIIIILGVIALLPATIAGIIFSILALMPGIGWTILAAIAGVMVIELVTNGLDSLKSTIMNKMVGYNLPKWVRDRISEKKISECLETSLSKINSSIMEEIKSDKSANSIAKEVAFSLSPQIETKINDIKYIIENN